MTPKDKFKKLVDLLYERTLEKKIDWQHNANLGVHALISGKLILLSETRNEDEEPLETVTIRNENGAVVDRFNDEMFSDIIPKAQDVNSYWKLMSKTREAAYRQAIGADIAIDDILSELDLDDDVPF